MVYYLLIFELQIKSYEFPKIRHKSDSNFCFKLCLNWGSPHVVFLLVRTGLFG
jgi:hypothetical protein